MSVLDNFLYKAELRMNDVFRRSIKLWWLGIAAAFMAFFWWGNSMPNPSNQTKPLLPLSALGADINETTVSGISSGAYMAGQFQLAHGKIVKGAAIVAGGPYGCAQSVFSGAAPDAGAVFLGASRAINGCMQNNLKAWGVPDPQRLAKKANDLADKNRIDSILHVVNDKVYLFSGAKDQTVQPPIVDAANEFYLKLGVPAQNILFKKDIEAGHGFVTQDEGGACAASSIPYIVDCDYDQAGAILSHLYANLQNPEPKPRSNDNNLGTFVEFNQLDYVPGERDHGLSKTGIIYVPNVCRSAPGCRVHIAFHGCGQNRGAVGGAFTTTTGFAPWADANRLLILFPQVSTGALNPTGCWDWWGYTGRDYLTKDAPQISAVRAMLEQLARTPGQSNAPST